MPKIPPKIGVKNKPLKYPKKQQKNYYPPKGAGCITATLLNPFNSYFFPFT
jgi:hypothetical protein